MSGSRETRDVSIRERYSKRIKACQIARELDFRMVLGISGTKEGIRDTHVACVKRVNLQICCISGSEPMKVEAENIGAANNIVIKSSGKINTIRSIG